jgi:AcrR family transcriptional regulator
MTEQLVANTEAGHQGNDSDDRVLSTAANLFRRKGYAQGTTRELAELLGLKKASLYHYVESKEDLLYKICIESLRRIDFEVATVAQASSKDLRLRLVICAHVESALNDRDLHTVMLTELRALSPPHYAAVVKQRDAYEQRLRKIIRIEQESGQIRSDVKAKHLTLALLNLLNWTIFWYQPSGSLSPADVGELLATLFLNGARVTREETRGAT